jgi:hypothetical protein
MKVNQVELGSPAQFGQQRERKQIAALQVHLLARGVRQTKVRVETIEAPDRNAVDHLSWLVAQRGGTENLGLVSECEQTLAGLQDDCLRPAPMRADKAAWNLDDVHI